MTDVTTLATGRFLVLASRGGWEFATRTNASGVVAVIAVTDDDEVVLVEQHRPAVSGPVIELPAGLVGDDPGASGEPAAEAARRELLEETGYAAHDLRAAGRFASSAGLTDECVDFYVARRVERTGAGGGVGGESITVHLVPRASVHDWLGQQMARSVQVDAKVLAGLALLEVQR